MQSLQDAPWFIISVKPKHEFIAEKNLRALGVEVYMPVYWKTKKVHKEKQQDISPLFAGYLFARFSIREFYHKIRYTRGVKGVLGSGDNLWTIDNGKISDIKNREDQGVVVLKRKESAFKKGDKIVIDEGDFDGWEGIFYEELPDKDRAVIMLTNVSYSSKLIVDKKFLALDK